MSGSDHIGVRLTSRPTLGGRHATCGPGQTLFSWSSGEVGALAVGSSPLPWNCGLCGQREGGRIPVAASYLGEEVRWCLESAWTPGPGPHSSPSLLMEDVDWWSTDAWNDAKCLWYHLIQDLDTRVYTHAHVLSHSVVSDSLWSMVCSLPGSSVHGIFQARILKWVAIFSSRGSS